MQIISKTNYNASEVQDRNNNDLFLSFAALYASGIQNGCSSLINTTKKLCKGFCSESKWAPTNLTNQTKSIVSCVTLINVLYTSATPSNQIVQLSGACYYHAELFRGSTFPLLKNLTAPAACLSVCLPVYKHSQRATLKKNIISRGEEGDITQVSRGLWFAHDTHSASEELHNPWFDHQSIEHKVLIWTGIHHCPLMYSGCHGPINQSIKKPHSIC